MNNHHDVRTVETAVGRCLQRTVAAAVVLVSLAFPAQAQQAATLEDVEGLLRAGVGDIIGLLQDDCIAFEVSDAAVARLLAAGADDAFIDALRGVCTELPPPPPSAGTSPGSAAVRSLLLPGLGQFTTGRNGKGVVFLTAWAGALGYGLLRKEITVNCLSQTTGSCPSGDVRDEVVKRPALAIGIGAALAVAVVSAIDARSGAQSVVLSAMDRPAQRVLGIEPVLPDRRSGRVGLQLRLRF